MSKLSQSVKNKNEKNKVINFMGGYSYEINPLDTLKIVTASSIFGEPQYYRNGLFEKKKIKDGEYHLDPIFKNYSIIDEKYEGKTTSEIMEDVIDKSLSYDFKGND